MRLVSKQIQTVFSAKIAINQSIKSASASLCTRELQHEYYLRCLPQPVVHRASFSITSFLFSACICLSHTTSLKLSSSRLPRRPRVVDTGQEAAKANETRVHARQTTLDRVVERHG